MLHFTYVSARLVLIFSKHDATHERDANANTQLVRNNQRHCTFARLIVGHNVLLY